MNYTYAVCENCARLNRVACNNKKIPVCGSCKNNLSMHKGIIESSDRSLLKLCEKSPLPVVVDVWAPWCGPCRSFAPTFEHFSQVYAGQAVFTKLNSDENPNISRQLRIQGIPTTLVFKNGTEVARQSGVIPQEHFASWLEPHIR